MPGRAAVSELKLTQIAELVYHQKTRTEIAEILQTNLREVDHAISVLREEWRQHRTRTAEEYFDEQLARLARLEGFVWPKAESGYMPAVERMLQLYDQRNKLLGLYAPAKSEMDVGEQLAKLLTRISEDPEPDPLPALPPPFIEGEYAEHSEDPDV